jgi:hypothetical protein
MVLAWRLKIFGDDAFGKVSAQSKVGASIVNHLIEKNSVFYPGGPAQARLPVSLRPLNDETFKAVVIELTKCTSDTNLQWYYVSDGEGDPTLTGLGTPPMALTSGSSPGAEILFKRSLHEVKGLLESQAYLKNLASADIAPACQQAVVLDGIAQVLNGQLLVLTLPTMSLFSLLLILQVVVRLLIQVLQEIQHLVQYQKIAQCMKEKKSHQLFQWPMLQLCVRRPHFWRLRIFKQ